MDNGHQRSNRPLRLQLWSYNYAPEPIGIAPVSTVWATTLRDRGHEVEVVAAHPHYPEPVWGGRPFPYREVRDGVPVLRLPLWAGRSSAAERIRQELTFAAAQTAALPVLGQPDVLVSVSPSFPALLPGIIHARRRKLPWVLWLHDLLPDGASATGLLEEGPVLRASRWLERAAYRQADRIVILSAALKEKLVEKGVAPEKIDVIYHPATHDVLPAPVPRPTEDPPRLLSMGNIGRTQAVGPLIREFQRSSPMRDAGVQLIVTGDGVAADSARAEISSGAVEMPGVVSRERLEDELRTATLAVVSQQYEGTEFNLPSRLMNFMAYGIPVLAVVDPRSEVARIVEKSGAGWVIDSSQMASFPPHAAAALAEPDELARRGRAGWEYARRNFSRQGFAEQFEAVLRRVAGPGADHHSNVGVSGDRPASRVTRALGSRTRSSSRQ